MSAFEIEIWPNPKKIKTIYITAAIVFALGTISFALGNIYWTPENVYWVRRLRTGTEFETGWPVNLYFYGMYAMIIGAFSFILVFFTMRDNKNPVLALKHDGIYINQQMIKQTFVEWSNIARIHKKINNGAVELDIYFVDANKIIEKQSRPKKAFLKENLKDGKPLTVNNKFSLGDLNAFAEKAITYKS